MARFLRRLGLFLGAFAAAVSAASGADPYAPDVPEPGSVEAIAKFTTEARFGNPWVAYVPASSTVASPTKYLGHVAGAAGELSNTSKIYGYFRELAKTSPRVRVDVIGKSEEGREILLATIADEEGIRDLDRLKAATAALSDPRTTSAEAAEKIIASARPIYYLNAGLHSTETGSPEMVMELAYRLAVSDQPMIQQIRKNLIVLINPVSEPDGRDKMVDWFYKYLKGKTDYENLPRESPPYWGYYVFHDNNRDTHQKALALTQAVHRMFYDYHPIAVHDLHESIPLLHTWNGTGPYNANLDPIQIDEWLEMSFHEVQSLTALGMPGVWTWGYGESWGLHYLDSVASNHNSIGRGYETFGNATAETVERTLRPLEERFVDKPVTDREWYRAWPPDKKFMWSLRDNANYMETGCLSILDWTARNAKETLRNYYRKGYNSWQKGVKGKPFAFVIPEDQGDRRRVAQMIEILRGHRIEVSRLTAPITVKEGTYAKGAFVVLLDQPYRNYAVDLLEPQKFPETPYEPYDDVSWALPVHYGLEAKRIDDEKIRQARLEALAGPLVIEGRVSGAGPVYLVKDTGQEALLAARFRLSPFRVSIAEKAFKAGTVDYPAGSWILPAQDGLADALGPVARELGVDFDSAAAAPAIAAHDAPVPRVAVWHLWADTESVGWLRLALDQEKVPYAYIRDEEIRAGNLREKYDIILYGNTWRSLKTQIHGIDTKWGPLAYEKSAEYPNLGTPDASPDITGGIGWGGMANLQKFLDAGGLMITLGNGSVLAIEGGLVRNASRASNKAYTPGIELRVKFNRPDHPLAYGYPAETSAFRDTFATYDLEPNFQRFMVLQWGTRPKKEDRDQDEEKAKDDTDKDKSKDASKGGPMVVSGGGKNLDDLEGHPAILDLPAGKGRVLAFNFNPLHRDLNHSDYRFVWNGILNWSGLPPAQP